MLKGLPQIFTERVQSHRSKHSVSSAHVHLRFRSIAFVPRRVLKLYEAVYAYPKNVCDMAEEDIRLADEAREGEHHDTQHFIHMYEH